MKPPHSNRFGGSNRPPSDRGPFRGAGGPSQRPSGQGPSASRHEGPRGSSADGQPRHAGGGPGRHADHTPASGGARSDGPRSGGPRFDGPRTDAPRSSGPRFNGPGQGGAAKRGSGQGGFAHSGPRHSGAGHSNSGHAGAGQASGARAEYAARAVPPQDATAPAPNERDSQTPRPGNGGKFQRPDRERQSQRTAAPRPQYHDADRHGSDAPKGALWLYGHHAIVAALANPSRRLRRLLLTEEAEAALSKLLPQPWPLAAERVDRPRLDQLLGRDIVHQGSALLADPLAPPSLQSVLERPGPIIVLDQVSDPRNVGAIMRSAAAFGAAAVIAQDRNAPEENGALAKAASGALETMPLLRAVNIARTLIALKAANIWCVGLDAGGSALSAAAIGDRRVALVLGAEGDGLRRLTRETCDEVAGLTIKGGVDSLNVSAAAAVAMYEITRKP